MREATFLGQDGRTTGPVKHLDFTRSMLEPQAEAELIVPEPRLTRDASAENFIGGITVAALKLRRFAFTSATEF